MWLKFPSNEWLMSGNDDDVDAEIAEQSKKHNSKHGFYYGHSLGLSPCVAIND